MRTVVLAVVCILIVGALVHPLITGASNPTASSVPERTGGRAETSERSVEAEPAPAFAELRGTPGFWRIGRTGDGVWWFVSPTGTAEWLNTVTTVVPYQLGRDTVGPHYASKDWSGRHTAEDLRTWAAATLARVREKGFKGLGAWSHPIFHEFDVPITRDLNVWTYVATECRRFYSPQWAETARRAIREQVLPLRENVHLVGYYTDNELDWSDAGAGPALYFDNLAPNDPNRQAVIRVIRDLWPTVEAFNADWGTGLTDLNALTELPALPTDATNAYGQLFSAWLERLARDYFRLTTELIREYDPNHLILGVRFKGYAPREVVRASRGYTDAQSINYYVSDGRLDADMFRWIYEESGQPIIVTEYAFHALDGRSGNRNTVGFSAQVPDQQARADGYRLFTGRLARVPFVIGADWFQWNDEPPSGRTLDGEDVNFGIVDIDDRPYELLAQAVLETTPTLNRRHAGSANDDGTDVWRESYAVKPSMTVPYLVSPPRLNGELSDWPAAALVQGIRHGRTIGLERSPLPRPNVLLGWTAEGLYVGFEVFDHDIQSAPPKGWWWTRDCVELFVSTRPVSSDQVRYDAYCHQFFFVTTDTPVGDGAPGVVGQWHRTGDALSDHLIPHPAIKDAVRVLPDRYVVEMFIPAPALHGFDPASTRELAVNVHVRNFQHATDYYWSAPKEAMTQMRPNTWGVAYLQPPPAEALAGNDRAR
jgi:hypothetical protein